MLSTHGLFIELIKKSLIQVKELYFCRNLRLFGTLGNGFLFIANQINTRKTYTAGQSLLYFIIINIEICLIFESYNIKFATFQKKYHRRFIYFESFCIKKY